MPKSELKKKKNKKEKTHFFIFFKKIDPKVIRTIVGLIFAALSIFTLFSLISYLFTWNLDQSLHFSTNIREGAENSGGMLGYLWANFLIGKLFGIGAFIIPFFFGAISIFSLKLKEIKLTKIFFLSLFGCIILSMTSSYIISFTEYTSIFGTGAGGSYGDSIINWLILMVGKIGTAGILVLLITILAILINKRVIDWSSNLFNKIFTKETIALEGNSDEEEESENDNNEQESEESEESGDDGDGNVDDGENEEDIAQQGNNDSIEFEILDTTNELNNATDDSEDSEDSDDSGDSGDSDEEWRAQYDPRLSLSHYKMPNTSLLEPYSDLINQVSKEELETNKNKIVSTLKDYKINISKISARIGPTVTLYEIVPAPGVRVSSIKRLEEDIALSLAARGVRIVTLVGTNAIGIEVANEKPSVVSMKSVLEDQKFINAKYDLPIALGRTISSEVMCFDLAKMPHLLVAGATGQGKSVGLNAIIASLLYKKHPAELKFVLVDPKKVELSLYSPITNHYLAQLPDAEEAIITDNQKVVYTLRSLCKLMDRRYDLLKAASVRNVKEYNEKFLARKLNPDKGHDFMPYIVVIIDEFADLLMTAGREVEEPIARLAQLARAIGIHLVIATQRPTTNIITGTIKANFPARIAFRVISSIDSKTILDQTGANQLIGRGDMLIYTGSSEPVRVQCALIDTPEVNALANYISNQQSFGTPYILPEFDPEELKGGTDNSRGTNESDRDELFADAARLIVREQTGSTSLLQRKMGLGYNRAGRIMDQLEEAGIVGPSEGSKARQVRISSVESLDLIIGKN